MKTFLSGKKTSEMPSLAPSAAATRHRIPALGIVPSVPAAEPRPNIEAVKEGDKVVRLVVTCACGERTEIECLYPAGS